MVDVVALRPPGAPFVAREAELGRLRELSAAAGSGAAAAVLLAGDAGVGKTSLISMAAARADEDGLLVLFGRCVDLGAGTLPYLPFAEALSQVVRAGSVAAGPNGQDDSDSAPIVRAAQIVREVARERPGLGQIVGGSGLLPGPARGPGGTGLDRLALFEGVSSLLGRIGDEVAPVLLVIEDLHWADTSTRDLVRFLLARLGGDRLLVVASYRADDLHRRHPLRPLLGELLRLPQVERMELQPFGTAELAEFLAQLNGGDLEPDVIARIAARSAGNAYYAEELLAAGGVDRLPTGLADVLLDRLERLSPDGQQVIRVAAVLGAARIEDTLLRACAQVEAEPGAGGPDSGGAVEAGLREAITHHLLVPDGPDRYAFRHALLQEAVYADLLPGQRVRLHATAAHRLVAAAQPGGWVPDRHAAELARHSLAAHDLPLALSASLRAAASARAANGPAEALVHYEQALQLWEVIEPGGRPEGRNLTEIGLAAAEAAGDAGRYERAVQLASAALAVAGEDPEQVAAARAATAKHTYATQRPVEAAELARRVIADLDPGTPSAARVQARSIQARVYLDVDPEAALEVLPAALAEAEELGLDGLWVELLTSLAVAEEMTGRPGAARAWDTARAVAERAGDRAAIIRVLYNTAIDRIDRGELAAGIADLEQAIRTADAIGLSESLYGAQSRSLLITIRWQSGDGEGALAVVRPDQQLSASLGRRLQLFALPVQAARDPQQVIDCGARLVVTQSPWHHQVLETARAEALVWLRRWDEAVVATQRALDFTDADAEPYALVGISISTTGVGAMADAAALARERADRAAEQRAIEQAAPFVRDARERAERGRPRRFTMGPEGLAWLARLDLEVARLHGEDDESGWGRVAEAFAGVSVYEAARARWRRAGLLARAGARDRARTEATAARRDAVRLGARPLIEALDELARRGRFEVSRPAPGAAVLTPREQDVMVLVAQGLTNRVIGERLFISEKTASVHVSNVLAKLGASGRAEAVAILARDNLLA